MKELLIKIYLDPNKTKTTITNSKKQKVNMFTFTLGDKQVSIDCPIFAKLIKPEDLVDLAYDINWDEINEINVRPVQESPHVLDH